MPAEIINFNRFRKAKVRDDKDRQAEANRAKFGQPKAERMKAEAEEAITDRRLEGHRLTALPPLKAVPGDGDENGA